MNSYDRYNPLPSHADGDVDQAPVPGKETLVQAIQRKAGAGPGSYAEAAQLVGSTGGGQALPTGVRGSMERSMGADFSDVRVHEGPEASALGARAYTQGADVHFAPGQYAPDSQPGQELLGHELAHVVQQREGRVATPQAKPADGVAAAVVSDAGLEAEADAMGAAAARGEVARPGASTASGAGAGAAIQRKPDDGITGGRVSHADFLGTPLTGAEQDAAKTAAGTEDHMTLAAQAGSITTGEARSEREMLASIELGNTPRFIARVGPRDGFGYGTFANPNRPFVFATEPADLRGMTPAAAMFKVGWTKQWIQPNIGKDIVICIFDTSVAVENPKDGTKNKVEQGKMEWPELTAAALADQKFKDAAEAKGIDEGELRELFEICSQTPVKGTPRTDDPDKRRKATILRELIDSMYGANELYTGMGATLQANGQLGGREVMIRQNGTGLRLTPDNHQLVSIGTLTQADYDSLP